MYLVTVIPLTKSPIRLFGELTYFSIKKVKKYWLVKIILNKKETLALVINATSIRDKKAILKKQPFQIKKIVGIQIKTSLFQETNFKYFKILADYFYLPIGALLKKSLPSYLLKNQKSAPILRLKNIKSNKNNFNYKIKSIIGNLNEREELYFDIIKKTEGSKILFLTPDNYSLKYWKERLGGFLNKRIIIFHSGLSEKNKLKLWQDVRNNNFDIILGLKSAVLLPFQSLNLIIIDDCGSDFFKFQEGNLKIDAKKSVFILAKTFNSFLLRGSKEFDWSKDLENINSPKKKFLLVDLKKEREQGNISPISKILQKAIKENLSKNQLCLLFSGRKGFYTNTICSECGYSIKCQNCDTFLVYYNALRKLVCRYCGFQTQFPDNCPFCKGYKLRSSGTGMERIEQEIKQIFPNVNIQCLEANNFSANPIKTKTDIIISTQVILKENIFSNVPLVGIINIDEILIFPDFKANQKAYEAISYLESFKSKDGKLIIQTYQQDNDFFHLLKSGKLINNEMQKRQILNYPPFSQLIKLSLKGKNGPKIKLAASALKERLNEGKKQLKITDNNLIILGPVPSFISKKRSVYSWNIILKNINLSLADRNKLFGIVPLGWLIDIDPQDIL